MPYPYHAATDSIQAEAKAMVGKETVQQREAHQSDPAESLRPELNETTKQISRMMKMASQLEDPAPALREIDQLEKKRKTLATEIARLEKEYSAAALLEHFSEANVKVF